MRDYRYGSVAMRLGKGGAALFIYVVHLRDPVFIIGQSTGAIIYLRNLYFRLRESAALA